MALLTKNLMRSLRHY